jgi:hypothetical protein
MITTLLSFLPTSAGAFSGIVTIILLLFDGVLFGLAVKKGLMSAVLIILGIIVAGLLGLSLPLGLSAAEVVSKVFHILAFQAQHGGTAIVYTFPIWWLIGFGLGIWKG